MERLHVAPSALRDLPAGYLGRCPRLLHCAPLVLMKMPSQGEGKCETIQELYLRLTILQFASDVAFQHDKLDQEVGQAVSTHGKAEANDAVSQKHDDLERQVDRINDRRHLGRSFCVTRCVESGRDYLA